MNTLETEEKNRKSQKTNSCKNPNKFWNYKNTITCIKSVDGLNSKIEGTQT